jgi:hypothetical protein
VISSSWHDVIGRDEAMDVRVLAHLVRDVLDLAGLKFDADGRCPRGAFEARIETAWS